MVFLNNAALFPCKNKNRSTKRSHKYSDLGFFFIDMPSSFSHILSNPIPKTPKWVALKSHKNLTTNIDKNKVCSLMTARQVFPLLWTHGMMMKFEFILSSLSLWRQEGGLSLLELSIPPVNTVAMSAYCKQNLAWIFTLCVVFWDYSHYVYVSIYIGYT